MQGKSTKNPACQSHCARFTLSLLGFSESAPKPAAEATVRCMEMSGTRTFEVCHKEKDTKMGHLDPTRRPPFHFFAFLFHPSPKKSIPAPALPAPRQPDSFRASSCSGDSPAVFPGGSYNRYGMRIQELHGYTWGCVWGLLMCINMVVSNNPYRLGCNVM